MYKKIISYIIVFILIILVFTSSFITIISTTLLNKNFIYDMLDKQEYYSKAYEIIIDKCKDNTVQSGLSENILYETISRGQVENDIKSLIEYIYNNVEYSNSAEVVKTKLEENINRVVEENNKTVSKDEQKAINIYIKAITNIYEEGTIISEYYLEKIHNLFTIAQEWINKISIILFISIVVLLLVIIVINKLESIKYISISLISTGMLLIIIKVVEAVFINTKNILLLNQALSDLIINAVDKIVLNITVCGVTFFIIGLALSVFRENK